MAEEMTDRQKVNAWLDYIHEFDQATRDEILEQCKTDISARKYFVKRSENDLQNI